MTTFEVLKSTKEQRQEMKETVTPHGCTLEFLEVGAWNVSCEDREADLLTSYLDTQKLEYRMV